MPEYVWVKDPGTGHSGPLLKSEADELGNAVKVDPKHDTHDTGGELLRWVTKTSVDQAADNKSGQAATPKEK